MPVRAGYFTPGRKRVSLGNGKGKMWRAMKPTQHSQPQLPAPPALGWVEC